MKKDKQGKPYTIMSTNPKMDTSGLAEKPMDYGYYMVEMEFKRPTMPLGMMVKEVTEKRMK